MMTRDEVLELASQYEEQCDLLDERKTEIVDPLQALQCQSELNELRTAVMALNRVLEGNLKEERGT